MHAFTTYQLKEDQDAIEREFLGECTSNIITIKNILVIKINNKACIQKLFLWSMYNYIQIRHEEITSQLNFNKAGVWKA